MASSDPMRYRERQHEGAAGSSDDGTVSDHVVTLIFGDLVGYSAATEAHGDETAAALALRLADMADAACAPDVGDRLVKSIGDAVLCTAADPESGLRLAARLTQFVLAESNFPVLRMGLCHGPVVERRNDVFGATVNLASRIAGVAEPGEVLATSEVAEAAVRMGLPTSRLGPRRLKNLHEPYELFVIDLRGDEADTTHVIDPVCRMKVDPTNSPSWTDRDDHEHWFCSARCLEIYQQRLSQDSGG